MSAKILVVDDDLESLKLIGMILQAKGYQIIAARDGQQALEKAFQEAPDLVILDVMMPGLDGYAVCQRLRADPRTSTIPIIMFTAKAQLTDKVIGLQSGADEYLTKPIHPRELIAHVEAMLARAARFKATARPSLKAKVIGFLGCKGGVGTSTLVVNVGVALARGPAQGKKVALLDFRLGMSTLALQLGLTPRESLQQMIEQPIGTLNAEAILAQMERHPSGVMVLGGTPAPLGTAKPIPPLHADAITRHLGTVVDYILIDLGSDLGEVNRSLLRLVDYVLLVIEPHRIALLLAQAMLAGLEEIGVGRHRVGVILYHSIAAAVSLDRGTVESFLQQEIKAIVSPAAELAFQAAEQGQPMLLLQPESVPAMQFHQLAEFLTSL
jgi:DNA-binding response OmpR family regulator